MAPDDSPAKEPAPLDRRAMYFAFQGLFMAVLLLIFLLHHAQETSSWLARLAVLTVALAASLAALRLASAAILSKWLFQVGLFVSDAALAALTLHWARPQSQIYPIFLLIIFGTALTRSVAQSLAVAAATSILYLGASWDPLRGLPKGSAFWIQLVFLWVASALLAVLARDSQLAQSARERRLQERMVEAERLSALGRLSAEVAHRIKGPLTTIMVNAELLAAELAGHKAAAKDLRRIEEEAKHCKEILKILLDLGRIEEMDLSLLDLREPVRSAVRAIDGQARRRGVRIELLGFDAPAPVEGDPSLLHEAVAALLQNALEASRKGGLVRVRLKARASALEWALGASGSWWDLEIADDGEGIAPEDLSRIFRPFFTTRRSGGSGLGLSSALRILQKHGGTIEAESEGRGRGAAFTLSLPKSPSQGARPA